jgi:hypothetical protein
MVANPTLDVFIGTSFSVITANYSTLHFSIWPMTFYLRLDGQRARSYTGFMTKIIQAFNVLPSLELHVQPNQMFHISDLYNYGKNSQRM